MTETQFSASVPERVAPLMVPKRPNEAIWSVREIGRDYRRSLVDPDCARAHPGQQQIQRPAKGLPRISPTVLNTRLKELEERGVIIKRRLNGQRGYAYHLTAAGRELSAVVEALAVWGMRWARDEMGPEDLDVSFLMFDIQRRI